MNILANKVLIEFDSLEIFVLQKFLGRQSINDYKKSELTDNETELLTTIFHSLNNSFDEGKHNHE